MKSGASVHKRAPQWKKITFHPHNNTESELNSTLPGKSQIDQTEKPSTLTQHNFDAAAFEKEFVHNAYSSIAHAYLDRRQHEWDCVVNFLLALSRNDFSGPEKTPKMKMILDVGVGSGKYYRTVDTINYDLCDRSKNLPNLSHNNDTALPLEEGLSNISSTPLFLYGCDITKEFLPSLRPFEAMNPHFTPSKPRVIIQTEVSHQKSLVDDKKTKNTHAEPDHISIDHKCYWFDEDCPVQKYHIYRSHSKSKSRPYTSNISQPSQETTHSRHFQCFSRYAKSKDDEQISSNEETDSSLFTSKNFSRKSIVKQKTDVTETEPVDEIAAPQPEHCRTRKDKPYFFESPRELLVADGLHLPFRPNFFDAVISIAVLHHLSTEQRRILFLQEILRVLRPQGHACITVWAAPPNPHRNKKEDAENDINNVLDHQELEQREGEDGHDVFVPWKLEARYAKLVPLYQQTPDTWIQEPYEQSQNIEVPAANKEDNTKALKKLPKYLRNNQKHVPEPSIEYQRFYHMFHEGELVSLIEKAHYWDVASSTEYQLKVTTTGLEKDNYFVILKKVTIQ